MKTRFLCSALVLSLCAMLGYAAPSVEELEAQMNAKLEQMNLLNEKIIKLDEAMILFRQTAVELSELFIEARKRKFLSENPSGQITEQELRAAVKDEWMRFLKSFCDIKNKQGACIVDDAFFNGVTDRDVRDASVFKFYIIKYTYDGIMLHKLLSEWEKLSDEYLALENQIKTAKGL